MHLSRYLQLVCSHPILGRSQTLADFLVPTYAGVPDKSGRKSLFAKLAESFAGSSQPSKVPMHDIEEFFQNERDWANNYSAHLKTVLNAVLTVVHVEKSKIALSLAGKITLLPLFMCCRNNWTAETSLHGSDHELTVIPSNHKPSPLPAALENGRGLPEHRGLCAVCHNSGIVINNNGP